ncbi:uncharacterized protein LOC132198601 [Neocloeon triangulifer]|uniref:uncharacterized protein LOC132198601 n=1 Tax=Neocloeon triangulifer TaxID=2078957 RepID=UPI00286F7462|nr:uncharacterized protein LOC132198601 [Neocloeon triangulifer]
MRQQISFLAVLLLLAAAAQAKPTKDAELKVTGEEINNFVDRLINEIKKYIIDNNLDPVPLPDLVEGFSYEDFLGIVWHGEASMRNGQMTGITSLYRNGDADFTYENFNLTVSAQMGLLAIKADYDFQATFMDLGPTGHAEIFANDILFGFSFSFDMNIANATATLHSFEILSTRKIDVNITGLLWGLNFLVEVFVNLFVDIFKGTILNVLSSVMENALREALANISFGVLML